MYERSGAPRRWESRTESEREGVRVAPGLGLVRDRVERVALLAMQSSPAPLPGDEVAGGTSVYVASVAAALAAVGVSCDIYTRATSPDQPVLRDLGPGVRLVSVEAGPLAPLGRTQLVPLVQTFTGNLAEVGEDLGPYQLLSAHWWLSGLAGLRLRAWWRVPMEFRPHSLALARNRALVDLALARSPARSQCEARIIDRADLLVAGSESESADLMGHYGTPVGKVRVIPCGVDPELFRPGDPQRARDRLGVDLTARHLLAYVGRLDTIKGVELAIETLAALSDHWPSLDVELLLVGGSTDPVRYRQQVAALRHRVNWQAAAGRVHFIPAQPHRSLPSVYQAADLLLMPSRTETFGLVALEAQACGTPVVASRAGSLPEVVSDRITGALVTRRDPGAWARTIAALLGCPARLQAMRALAFGLLSLPDGPDLSLAAAAQLLGRDEGPTQMLLERLIDVQMLQSPAPGRYQMHDLLRLFAREQAQRQERPEARRAALRRVLHWYRATAQRANRLVQPANLRRGGDGEAGGAQFQDRAGAMAWLEEERKNLLAAARQAAKQPRPLAGVTVALADALFFFAQTRGYWRDWEELNQLAIQVSRRLGDRTAESRALSDLAGAYYRFGRLHEAIEHLEQALRIHRDLGDLEGESAVLGNLTIAYHESGRLEEAIASCERGRMICRQSGYRYGEAIHVNTLARVYQAQGRLDDAIEALRVSLEIFEDLGDAYGQGNSLANLGEAYRLAGRPSEAVEFCERGLARFREVGDRSDEAEALARLGSALDALGDHEQARLRWREALDIFSAIGAPRAAEILTLLGEHPTTE